MLPNVILAVFAIVFTTVLVVVIQKDLKAAARQKKNI
tara:strand:- start:66 stop:176 length:111 start_codon:yes stop_codon:yes gene_type:complete